MDGPTVCGGSVSHERPGRLGGLARKGARLGDDATGGVGRDGLVLELADGEDGADGFEDFHGGPSLWGKDTPGAMPEVGSEPCSSHGPGREICHKLTPVTELALALLATLAVAEVIARWFGWRKDRSTWGRFAVGPISVFVAVAVLTVVGIALFEMLVLETSQTRVSLIAAGIQLFGAGWVIRYWTIVPVALHRKPILRKGFHWLQELHWRGFLRARHPRYAGLWLEVVGFALIIGGPIALVASCGLAAILTLAARLEEELIELRGPQYAERIAVARQFNPNAIWRTA